MKHILTTILLITYNILSAQTTSNIYSAYIIEDTVKGGKHIPMTKAGSCSSPDGSMMPTTITPPNYTWLQTNGYCKPKAYGTNPTVCWTFTPTSSSVNINSGYAITGCNNGVNIIFSQFRLFNSSCVQIGTGLTYTTLTPGQTYTWCMTGSTSGGGGQCNGFTDFCPYYINNIVMPIELISFYGDVEGVNNKLIWTTASERSNDYFTIEKSLDGMYWDIISKQNGAGNSQGILNYKTVDYNVDNTFNYYRLSQTDFDGKKEIFPIILIDNTSKEKDVIIKTINILGQEVEATTRGVVFTIYKNGEVRRKYN